MATCSGSNSNSNSNIMDILIVHGSQQIPIVLDISNSSIGGGTLTVHHLAEGIERATNIATDAQKLIHRGKILFRSFHPENSCVKRTLSSVGISNGARIMVLGKPDRNVPTDEEQEMIDRMDHLDEYDVRAMEMARSCSEIMKKINNNEGNAEEWKKQKNRIMAQSERAMKFLTKIDATPSGNCQRYKSKRKRVIDQILSNLDYCDKQVENINKAIEQWNKEH